MRKSSLKVLFAVLVSGFLIIPFAKQALSQEPPKVQANVDDKDLKAFAKVYVQVEKIRRQYEPRLRGAQDAEKSKEIEKEALSKLEAALTEQGLTQESYIQIFQTVRADETLRKKVLAMIDEERKKS